MHALKKHTNKPPIHTRSIEIKSYAIDDDTIVVEGWLKDDRHRAVHNILGEQTPAGPIHQMAIRIMVGNKPLTILDAEAEMAHVPYEFCNTTLSVIKGIIGLQIKRGIVKQFRNLIGGEKGCTHLTHLLTTMSQAALHGYFVNKYRHPCPPPKSLDEVEDLEFLLGSCPAWAENGYIVQKLKSIINSEK